MSISRYALMIAVCLLSFGCSEKQSGQQSAKIDDDAQKASQIAGIDTKSTSVKNAAETTETPKPDDETDSKKTTPFTVDVYDPERDAVKDLEMTTKLAASSGKRILIEVGGKW